MTAAREHRPNILDTALRLASMGISVIPIKARDKKPVGAWKEFQTRRATEDEIRVWFANKPTLNIGIVTGAISRVVVIDADSEEMATRVGQLYPSPMRSKTSQGRHFFYRHPGHTVGNRAKIVGLALDVRGDGGYVVAPGSTHPSGIVYLEEGTWGDIEDLPVFQASWLGEQVQPLVNLRTAITERIRSYLDATPGAVEGEAGDAHTFRVACKLVRGYDLNDDLALDYLSTWNAKCSPPWPLADLREKITGARSYGTGSFGYLLGAQQQARPQTTVSVEDGGTGNLQEILARNDKGAVKKTPGNLAKILRLDETWGPRLQLDEMTRDVLYDGRPVEETFVDRIQEQIEDRFQIAFGREDVAQKILAQAQGNRVHPVREWFQRLPEWDGIERIHRVPTEILHSDGRRLHVQYIRLTMVAGVRRVFEPGCKMDTVLTLVGTQGFRKSTFFRILVGAQWFGDSPVDIDSKDGFMVLHRRWFTELGEIDHTTSTRAAERIKAFVSSAEDTFRPPFARSVAAFPRTCIIVGSTNRDRFLNDPTGSRRFWPIKITQPINLVLLAEWREQLWAEAINLYSSGLNHWLEDSDEALRAAQSEEHESEDPWESQMDEALDAIAKTGGSISDGLTMADLMNRMGIPTSQQNRGTSMRLSEIMRSKGWVKQRQCSQGMRGYMWSKSENLP
jgi:hypothetical protein